MDIRCKKKISINKYEAILTLQVLNERLDVAKFLEEKLNSKNEIDIKIKEQFFKKNKLVEEDLKTLTKEGKEVLESKHMWESQNGEFNLYSIEDNFISKIIGIEAIDAFSLKFNTEKFIARINDDKIDSKINNKKYKIKDEIKFVKKDKVYEEKVDIEWNLNKNKEEIKIKFPQAFEEKEALESKGVSYEEFIENYVKEHGKKYNKELGKIEYGEEFIKFSENEINKFTCNKFDIDGKLQFELENKDIEFDEIKISNIGIMPDSKECAKKWGLYNLKSKMKEKYITSKEYKSISNDVYNRNEMKYWEIETLSRENFIKNNFNDNCFWNVSAPFDLLNKNILSTGVIQFNIGENISLRNFIDKLNINLEKVINIILIDNYAFTDKRKDKLLNKKIKILELLKKIVAPKNKFVIYTQKRDLEIAKEKIENNFTVESNELLNDKHPRYLFFIMKDEDDKLFTIDRSIDFINYKNIEFNENTSGEAKSFTISVIEKEKLEESIQNILNERGYDE